MAIASTEVDQLFFYLLAAPIVLGLFVFAYEVYGYYLAKKLKQKLLADMLASVATFVMLTVIGYFVLPYVMQFYQYLHQNFAVLDIAVSIPTALMAIVLADFVYYWEHRASHRINFLWSSHSVHHCETQLHITTALRFGPLYMIIARVFQLPLALIGFNPELLVVSLSAGLTYQFWIHTQRIGKLGFLEGILNTPSHHRVHHALNEKYRDKNYAGIFIIWDKLFGSFVEEQEAPNYGITTPVNSVNPIVVFFHGYVRLYGLLLQCRSLKQFISLLMSPPDQIPVFDKSTTMSKEGEPVV